MPEIARFFGIVIRMYAEAGGVHHLAHFHAQYQDFGAIFSIEPVQLIAGTMPGRQQRLVEAWAELHPEELLADWRLLASGHLPEPIDPLR